MTTRIGLKCAIAGGGQTITFNERSGGLLVPDGDGNIWIVQDIGGWDSADVRTNSFDDVGRDGIFYTMVEHQSRTLTLQGGLCVSPTEEARFAARNALASALNLTEDNLGYLHVWEDIQRQVGVYKATAHTAQNMWPGDFAGSFSGVNCWPWTFQAQLSAPNPWKNSVVGEGPFLITGGATTVHPGGTYPTWPVFHIVDGAPDDILLVNGLPVLTLTGEFTSGVIPSDLTVDFLAMTCVDSSGANAFDVLMEMVWEPIQPNVDTTLAWEGISATVHAEFYDAWI
jgi:hypothetical protein